MDEARVLPAIDLNDEITKAISEAVNPADIRAAILLEAEKQNATSQQLAADQATAEKAAADKLAAEQAAATAAPTTFSRTEVIGGKSFDFEAGSELELERLVTSAYKVAFSVQPDPTKEKTVDPAIAAAEAKRLAEEEAANKAQLEVDFKLGNITAADYIERSGAMGAYLEKQGVSLDKLKAVVNEDQDKHFAKSWEDAGEQFKVSAVGKDWPGGEKNKEQLGLLIVSMGLIDATDKVGAMAQAWAKMKDRNMIFPNEDVIAAPVVDAAAPAVVAAPAAVVAAPAVAAPAARVASKSSSLFGASSGTSGSGSAAAAPAAGAQPAIDPNASPAEIIAAWKEGQLKAGKDPNAAFTETFANGRRAS